MKARTGRSAPQLTPLHALLAAALLGLVVMPLAFAGAAPDASKSANLTKQLGKLKQRVAALEGKPAQTAQVPSSLPPSGAAGGALTGAYPSPAIAAGAVGPGELRNATPVVINEVLQSGGQNACDIGVHNTFCGVPGAGWSQPTLPLGQALYYVDAEGFVHMQGTAQAVNTTDGGRLFTLPIALAPAGVQDDEIILFPAHEIAGVVTSVTVVAVGVETSDGLPRVIVSAPGEGQNNDVQSLNGISWGTN